MIRRGYEMVDTKYTKAITGDVMSNRVDMIKLTYHEHDK